MNVIVVVKLRDFSERFLVVVVPVWLRNSLILKVQIRLSV